MPLEPAGLHQLPCAELVRRILEHAAERPLVRRLRGLPAGLQLCDREPDLPGRTAEELELDPRHHLALPEGRVPVGQLKAFALDPPLSLRVGHDPPAHYARPVPAVSARYHPHPSTRRPGNRARELETAQT